MNARRRFLASVQKLFTIMFAIRWLLLSVALVVIGVVSIFTFVPLWLNLGISAISIALVILEVRNFRKDRAETQFTQRPSDGFEDVRKALASNDRFKFYDFVMGTFVLDKTASRRLSDPDVLAKSRSAAYVVPIEFRSVGGSFRQFKTARNSSSYNGPVLGLDTDFGFSRSDEIDAFSTIEARYWDYLASDVLATEDTWIQGRLRSDIGRSLFIRSGGMPRDFGESWLLNAIGVSILAITSDGRYVTVMQSARNDSSPRMFSPSGSGSLEPKDYKGADTLPACELLSNGALRECMEESAIQPEEFSSVHLLGFGRWLQKAAKAEALLVGFLSIDSHTLARRNVPRDDRDFTQWFEPRKFVLPIDEWADAAPGDMVDKEVARSLSVPLGASLALLAETVRDDTSPVANEIYKRLTRR